VTSTPPLLVSRRGSVTELRLNRPDVRNAIDAALRAELISALQEIAASDETRVVIITGEGSAFCAGGDISAMRERLARPAGQVAGTGVAQVRAGQRLILALHELRAITIAAVNGPAAGYGMDLALACDFVIAADTSFFTMSYIKRGLVPDGGGAYFLPRRVGLSRAKELILTGRNVQAPEALSMGIADRVVASADLGSAAAAWADELAASPAVAAALAKSILNRSLDLSLAAVLDLSAGAAGICYTTEDHLRLVESFIDSRPRKT
jgi:enoyl-CoA hydratase/carnithine racemase